MSVIIKGMQMPKEGLSVVVDLWNNGKAYVYGTGNDEMYDVVELPDHGDLIEKRPIVDVLAIAEKNVSAIQRGAETEKDIRYCQGVMVGYANSILVIDNAPIIIPAERSEE